MHSGVTFTGVKAEILHGYTYTFLGKPLKLVRNVLFIGGVTTNRQTITISIQFNSLFSHNYIQYTVYIFLETKNNGWHELYIYF